MAKDSDFQEYPNDLFKKIQFDIQSSYNERGELHYYAAKEDFQESKSAIKKKAEDFFIKKLVNPSGLWKEVKKYVVPSEDKEIVINWPGIVDLDGISIDDLQTEELWKCVDSMASNEFNLYNLLLSYTDRDFQYNLERIAEIVLSVVYLYEFPLYNEPFLIRIREQIYQLQFRIFKKLRQPTDRDINTFRNQWIRDENANADKLAKTIELNKEKMIYVDYNVCRSTISNYKDYLKEQHSKNKDSYRQDENENEKPNYLGYALLHHYWYKHTKDVSKSITLKTKKRWSEHYQINERELWKRCSEIYADGADPLPGNHIAKIAFIEQYEIILLILKELCPPAFIDVEQKLKRLKKIN